MSYAAWVLAQAAEMRVRPPSGPELVTRTVGLRSEDCAVSLAWSDGLALDWGVQTPLVEYIVQQRRSQLSVVLAGRGYVATDRGDVALRTGDIVFLDQLRHDAEGYAPTDGWSQVLVVEWDDASRFGPAYRGPPKIARLGNRDVEELRALTERATTMPSEDWLDALAARLRALGLRTPSRFVRPPPAPLHVKELYRALGQAKELIEAHVSIVDVADELGLSERHVRRGIDALSEQYGVVIESWRSFLSDQRMHRAQMFLSVPDLPLREIARLSGFRSQIALNHALAHRGGTTPTRVARALAERWR